MIEDVGNKCCGCAACYSICPTRCITMMKDMDGFLYPVVDKSSCVNCGLCKKVCPMLQMNKENRKDLEEAYGLIHNDSLILKSSSSGGLFTALAQAIFDKGGCVFGAAFSNDFMRVQHIMTENLEELKVLRGSKYIQSDVGNSYKEVKEQLKNDRVVLFTGTPCQTAGLKLYLGHDYDNLFLVDIICHGTPSPLLWQKYLLFISDNNMSHKVVSVNFRNKEKGWQQYGMEICFENGDRYYRTLHEEPYMKLFLKDYCLRESCYQCQVKATGPISDITIGDFWGVEQTEIKMDIFEGISLALVHTEKGKKLLKETKANMQCMKTDYNLAINKNPSFCHSVCKPLERVSFFDDLRMLSWTQIEKKYTKTKFSVLLRHKLYTSFLGRICKGIDKKI